VPRRLSVSPEGMIRISGPTVYLQKFHCFPKSGATPVRRSILLKGIDNEII
jgi:hypothetical protein